MLVGRLLVGFFFHAVDESTPLSQNLNPIWDCKKPLKIATSRNLGTIYPKGKYVWDCLGLNLGQIIPKKFWMA
jgi:hypothetical protein